MHSPYTSLHYINLLAFFPLSHTRSFSPCLHWAIFIIPHITTSIHNSYYFNLLSRVPQLDHLPWKTHLNPNLAQTLLKYKFICLNQVWAPPNWFKSNPNKYLIKTNSIIVFWIMYNSFNVRQPLVIVFFFFLSSRIRCKLSLLLNILYYAVHNYSLCYVIYNSNLTTFICLLLSSNHPRKFCSRESSYHEKVQLYLVS